MLLKEVRPGTEMATGAGMTDHSVSCPQARSTKNRRKSMSKTWQTIAWKKAAKDFVTGQVCEWCGSKDKLLPHHPYQNAKDGVYPDRTPEQAVAKAGLP